jgi:hypothetical protein
MTELLEEALKEKLGMWGLKRQRILQGPLRMATRPHTGEPDNNLYENAFVNVGFEAHAILGNNAYSFWNLTNPFPQC